LRKQTHKIPNIFSTYLTGFRPTIAISSTTATIITSHSSFLVVGIIFLPFSCKKTLKKKEASRETNSSQTKLSSAESLSPTNGD